MAVSIAQYVDLLFKKLQGVAKTANATVKDASNESIASPAFLRGDVVWTQSDQIPATAQAVANITLARTGANSVQTVADTTVPPIGGIRPTWLTNVTYWVPQEFGATWLPKVYVGPPGAANIQATGTQIFSAGIGGVGEYYFDTQAGVLNFIGETIPTVLTSGNVVYVAGYQYVGELGVTNLPSGTNIGNLQITGNTIFATVGNLVTVGNSLSVTGNVTASNFIGNFSGNTTGNVSAGGANTQIQFNDSNLLAGSAAFTFNKTSNLVTVAGNITSNTVLVGNIVIPATGNVTMGNVNINNLAEPVANSDAATKFYVDSVAANVLPIISNQTISPDGVANTFTLNQTATAVGILLTINGVTQTPVTNYTVTGNSLTMTETPLSSDIIQIRYLTGTQVGNGGGGTNYANANVVAYGELGWAGNIIPSGNAVYSLGNATNQWKDLYVSGNTIYIGNVPMTVSGNVLSVAGNAVLSSNTTANISTTGNVVADNVLATGVVSASGNVRGGNINTAGAVSATGNITGNYILGNGSQLTGLPATYSNANVATFLAAYGSNTISTTGNITGGNLIVTNATMTGNLVVNTSISSQGATDLWLLPATGTTRSYGNINPFFANTYNLGGSTTRWNTIFANVANVVTLNSVGNVTGTNFVGNVIADTVSATGNITGGNVNLTGNLTVNGNPIYGVLANYGEVLCPSVPTIAANTTADIQSFTLPTEGVYEVTYVAHTRTTSAGAWVSTFLTDNSNVVVDNSQGIASYIANPTGVVDFQGSVTVTTLVTTATANAVYKLRATATGNTGAVLTGNDTGVSKITWNQIGGQAPITGFSTTGNITGGNLSVSSNIFVGGSQAVNGPAFNAGATTGTPAVASGVFTKVAFSVEQYDTNNNYDTSTSRFTPTVAGYYQFDSTVRFVGNLGTGEYLIALYKNGTEWRRGTNGSGTSPASNFYSLSVSCQAFANGSTDYFEVFVLQTSGGNLNYNNGTNITYFSGCMMRGA